MIFDKSEVYTAVNADELKTGDLVVLADTLCLLKKFVAANLVEELSQVYSDTEECRFCNAKSAPYALAYLVCTKRNAEAYKAWHEGKKIEKRVMCKRKDGEWQEKWELECNPNFIYSTLRVAPEKETYRPFKTNQELLDTWNKKTNRKAPELTMPLIWVRDKEENTVSMINAFIDTNVVSIAAEDIIELDELYEQYTFLDGSPCGVQE